MLVEIAPVADGALLPDCTPFLMPFHISYTGPAPISRYFRPRPALPSLATVSLRSSSTATVVATSSSTSVLNKTKSSLTVVSPTTSIGSLTQEAEFGEDGMLSMTTSSIGMGADSETQPALDGAPLDNSTSTDSPASRNVKRFVAAFRGRQVYGQGMEIPSGYGGLVLRTSLDSKGKGMENTNKAKPMSKTRTATRWLKHTITDSTADELEGGDDGDCYLDSVIDPPPPAKKLVPSSTFSSFMLWTPDRPVDEGRDEYARALVEWTGLANEIHSYDE